ALDRHLVDSYTVVLSRPPLNSSEVHISIDPPPGLVFVDKLLNEQRKADGSAKPLSLTFAGLDWYKAHTVYFKVDADPSLVEIPDVAIFSHTSMSSSTDSVRDTHTT